MVDEDGNVAECVVVLQLIMSIKLFVIVFVVEFSGNSTDIEAVGAVLCNLVRSDLSSAKI